MTARELLEKIGEMVFTEVDDVYNIEYNENSFTVLMENGKKFEISAKEI